MGLDRPVLGGADDPECDGNVGCDVMFDWRSFLGALVFFCIAIVIVGLIAGGFYMMCETGNPWGFALIVGTFVLGGSVAVGFGL